MSNSYNVKTTTRAAAPRSQRLKDVGGYISGGNSVITSGSDGGSSSCDGHTHVNKTALDAISIDNAFYLWLRQKLDGDSESTLAKVKAGYADEAQHAAEADHSADSDKWGGHNFADYMDQPVRRGDIVQFAEVIASVLRSPDFVGGIETGSGWRIDGGGNGEMNSLTLRSYLKVPQLIYNKIRVTGGEMWNTEGGTIKSVTPDTGSSTAFTLEMDLEDGDTVELDVDDICKGHFNSGGTFITSYFRVTYVDAAAGTVRIVLGADSEVPGGSNCAPVPYMNIARYGNFDDAKVDRQRSQYFSSSELRISLLAGVNTYIIGPQNYRGIFGTVPQSLVPANLPVGSRDVAFYGKYGLFDKVFEIDANGDIVRTIRDRGLWSGAVATSQEPYVCNSTMQDEVWHHSCKYRCIVDGTTQEPRYDSTDWLLVAGDTTLAMAIGSSEGEVFLYGHLDTILTARVKRGITDITSEIPTSDWSWTRSTGDPVADAAWNSGHAGIGNTCHITDADINGLTGSFTCQAYVRDGGAEIYDTVDF